MQILQYILPQRVWKLQKEEVQMAQQWLKVQCGTAGELNLGGEFLVFVSWKWMQLIVFCTYQTPGYFCKSQPQLSVWGEAGGVAVGLSCQILWKQMGITALRAPSLTCDVLTCCKSLSAILETEEWSAWFLKKPLSEQPAIMALDVSHRLQHIQHLGEHLW